MSAKLKLAILVAIVFAIPSFLHAQYTYKIKADSVRITNDSCSAELILENSTRQVKGFLYNKGNGRTEFRRAIVKLSDSIYLFGDDTLNINQIGGGSRGGDWNTLLNKPSTFEPSSGSGFYIQNKWSSKQATSGAWIDTLYLGGTTKATNDLLNVNGTATITGSTTIGATSTGRITIGVGSALYNGQFGAQYRTGTIRGFQISVNSMAPTSGNYSMVELLNGSTGNGWMPTTGNANFRGLALTYEVNQVGATGNMYGIYYNPAITAFPGSSKHYAAWFEKGMIRLGNEIVNPTNADNGATLFNTTNNKYYGYNNGWKAFVQEGDTTGTSNWVFNQSTTAQTANFNISGIAKSGRLIVGNVTDPGTSAVINNELRMVGNSTISSNNTTLTIDGKSSVGRVNIRAAGTSVGTTISKYGNLGPILRLWDENNEIESQPITMTYGYKHMPNYTSDVFPGDTGYYFSVNQRVLPNTNFTFLQRNGYGSFIDFYPLNIDGVKPVKITRISGATSGGNVWKEYGNKTELYPDANGLFVIGGGVQNKYTALSANTTLTKEAHNICSVNAASGAITITLPTAVGFAGLEFRIKKTDASANAVTIATTSSQTIDGAPTKTLAAQYDKITIVSNGANWEVY